MKNTDILIVGNGFDIYCDLKTKYEDFFGFCKLLISDEMVNIPSNIDVSKYKKNFWIHFFINFNDNVKTWGNFEEVLGIITNTIEKILQYSKIETIKKDMIDNDRLIESYEYYILVLNDINNLNYLDLVTIDCITKIDVPNVFYATNLFSKKYKSLLINESSDKIENLLMIKDLIYKNLERDLDEVSQLFSLYLQNYVNNVQISILKKELLNLMKPKLIISFNYTNTIERIFHQKPIYIHGSTDEQNIVFGAKNTDGNLIRFSKYYRCLRTIPSLDYNTEFEKYAWYTFENDRLETKKDVNITFIGFSFDESDADFIEYVFEKSVFNNINIYFYKEYESILINLAKIVRNDTLTFLLKRGQLKFIDINILNTN